MNACEPCFSVFTAAVEFQSDFPEYAVSPAAPTSRNIYLVAAFALLLISVGAGFLLRNLPSHEPGSKVSLAQLIEPLETGKLSDKLWPPVAARFRSSTAESSGRTSFQVGVLVAGAAVNFEEHRNEEARGRLEAVVELLSGIERATPRSQSALSAEQPGIEPIDEALGAELDSAYFRLGKWTELGRLAAVSGNSRLLTSETFRREGDSLTRAEFPHEIRTELETVGELIRAEAAPARLDEAFTAILLSSSRS